MRLKLILLLLVALLTIDKGWGADDRHLEIPDITVASGSVAYFQIDLVDVEQTLSVDAEIAVPDGFSILPQESDPTSTQYTLNLARNAKMTYNSSYPYNGNESIPVSYHNDVRFLIMTSDVTPITGGSGWLVKLPITTTAEPGTYEARMHTIHISNTAYEENDLPDIKVKITVTEPEEIRYTDNQLFCNDIEINQGEDAELILSYNSNADVYEYSTSVILPSSTSPNGDMVFSSALTTVENFTNNSTWEASNSILKIAGVYGGGRRDPAAPAGIQTIGSIKLNTASLAAGEYEIKIANQVLSTDDDDFTPVEYVGKLTVKSNTIEPTEKCSTPIISLEGNHLYVRSDTKGAKYHTSIVAQDHQDVIHGEDEPIELVGQYLVTSYASADGYNDSEPVTATLIWNKKEDINTGLYDIEVGTDRMLLLQSAGDNIQVAGIAENESIALYEMSGAMLYQGNSIHTTFTIPYSCTKGYIYIIKVGKMTYKYQF